MSYIPLELKYVDTHEWIRVEDDGTVTIGITDHAQQALGDVVFIDLPEVGAMLKAGDEAGVVESVKAASDIYAPLTGEVIQVNQLLVDAPETVNSDPYSTGWFFRLRPEDLADLDDLLDAEGYQNECENAE